MKLWLRLKWNRIVAWTQFWGTVKMTAKVRIKSPPHQICWIDQLSLRFIAKYLTWLKTDFNADSDWFRFTIDNSEKWNLALMKMTWIMALFFCRDFLARAGSTCVLSRHITFYWPLVYWLKCVSLHFVMNTVWMVGVSEAPVCFDHVSTLLRYHDGWGICVTRHHIRHYWGIYHS